MHLRLVLKQLGLLLLVLGGGFVAMAAFAGAEAWRGAPNEVEAVEAFGATAAITFALGAVLYLACRRDQAHLGRREATLLVVLSWIVGGAVAALPFFFWHQAMPDDFPEQGYRSFARCMFESLSGLTTCGATVLTEIELMPRSILLWRATTHWIGGLGIVVLFVAVLPSLGAAGKRMFLTESTGLAPEGLRPHVRETARILWLLYLGFTLSQIVLLIVAGMRPFDSVCHTFATLATGGFSTRNASIAAYDSWAIDGVVIAFMALGGVNFALFYRLIRGQHRAVLRDTEFRWYLALLLCGTVVAATALVVAGRPIVTVAGVESPATALNAGRHALFVIVSMQTTTGFCNADYETWPVAAKAAILVLAFVGGCGGSTGSGAKVIRFLISIKTIRTEVEREFRPTVVRPLKIGKSVIDMPVRLAALATIVAGVLLMVAGAVLLLLVEPDPRMDLVTAASASLVNLMNVGPGFGAVGPSLNYGWMSDLSLAILMPLMILGRLEIFAVLALVTPRYWRND